MITTMYPDPFRPGTEVCHYYTKEWIKMGYEVKVINLRSIFPAIYTMLASLLPKLAHRFIGNHVEMDRNKNIVNHFVDNISVYSIPVFKYIPHRRYPKWSIKQLESSIKHILLELDFQPDIITGHFYNPSMEIINRLKLFYPNALTCIVFHESNIKQIRSNYKKDFNKIISSFNIIGYRNKTIKSNLENEFGLLQKSFICYSGTHQIFIETPFQTSKVFINNTLTKFLYVGQYTKNKSIIETLTALQYVYEKNFKLTCVSDGGPYIKEITNFVQSNNLQENVDFVGYVDRSKLVNYYDINECFIMISQSEAFGLVYLEAMSRGCIVIGSRNQGIDGVIVDGENGFLCKGGDYVELANILERINLLSPQRKKTISENAIKTASNMSDYNVAKWYIEEIMNSHQPNNI